MGKKRSGEEEEEFRSIGLGYEIVYFTQHCSEGCLFAWEERETTSFNSNLSSFFCLCISSLSFNIIDLFPPHFVKKILE